MTVVAVASAKGSPGATTLALALAATLPGEADRPVLVIEADPDGGSLAARFSLGYEPGLTTLATAARRGLDETTLLAHSQPLAGRVRIVPGPAGSLRARAALAACGERVAERLRLLQGCDVVVDIGRAVAGSPASLIAEAADLCLLVLRPTVDGVQHAPSALKMLEDEGCRSGVVCIGDRPYSPVDIAAHLGAELVGVVADDARGAGALTAGTGGDRVLRRSMLWRTAAELSQALANRSAGRPADSEASADRGIPAQPELEPQS